ncbi:hypothetical protein PYCCODRAFT_707523 [Trametes coccinea BRFM310]|uniref:Uncharacterized protein n=1 Tax=Trametes coccinea (strain BRFM310) TaxID=1353009 RepID=A0A1Y2IJW9_TRAC3|nr:hypothetical protein PYCCODRAFT_707523 [Trametes coccinea BRFM310]
MSCAKHEHEMDEDARCLKQTMYLFSPDQAAAPQLYLRVHIRARTERSEPRPRCGQAAAAAFILQLALSTQPRPRTAPELALCVAYEAATGITDRETLGSPSFRLPLLTKPRLFRTFSRFSLVPRPQPHRFALAGNESGAEGMQPSLLAQPTDTRVLWASHVRADPALGGLKAMCRRSRQGSVFRVTVKRVRAVRSAADMFWNFWRSCTQTLCGSGATCHLPSRRSCRAVRSRRSLSGNQ